MNPITNKELFERLNVIYRVLIQQLEDKKKCTSIHEPEVLCTAKGKEHTPYESGNKSSFAYTRKSGIIVGAMDFEENTYDGHMLKPQLMLVRELTGGIIKKVIADMGYKIKEQIGSTEIVMPILNKQESYYKKNNERPDADPEQALKDLSHT